MSGATPAARPARAVLLPGPMAADLILETRGLTWEFKGFVAVKSVDLAIRRGSIHALIGPNGAGKTSPCSRAARCWPRATTSWWRAIRP